MINLSALILICISQFSYASGGGKKVDYKREVALTQKAIDAEIIGILKEQGIKNNVFRGSKKDNEYYLGLNDQKYLDLVIDKYNGSTTGVEDSYIGQYNYLLYQQFIQFRHSSKKLSKAIFDFQLSHFTNELNSIAAKLNIAQVDFKKYQEILRDDVVERYHTLLKKISLKINDKKLYEKSFLEQLNLKEDRPFNVKNINLKLLAFCKFHYTGHHNVCTSFQNIFRQLDFSQATSYQVFHTGLLAKPEYLKLFSSSEIVKPITDVALSLLKIRQNLEKEVPSNSIYDVFILSFVKHGFTEDQAHNYTMDIMSYYGQRGASFSYSAVRWFDYIFSKDDNYLVAEMNTINLSLIYSAISMIDKYTFEKNKKHFSVPKGISSEFLIGKPYYFWMSAMLARDLVAEFPETSHRSAVKAVQLFNQAYQLSAGHLYNKRDPDILSHKYKNHTSKLDMIVGLSGALWAISPDNYSLDSPLEKVFIKSKDTASDNEDFYISDDDEMLNTVKHIRNWNRVFRPKVAIKELFKQYNVKK